MDDNPITPRNAVNSGAGIGASAETGAENGADTGATSGAATRGDGVTRRAWLSGVGLGGVGLGAAALTGAGVNPAAAAGEKLKEPAAAGDRLYIRSGPNKKQQLRPDLLEVNAKPVTVYPVKGADGPEKNGERLNRMLALRLDPAEMDEETRAASADGVLLYSALCTHKACTIKAWKEEDRHLRCHCHLSEFKALEMGAVATGPARAPLPIAPTEVDDEGFVRLTGGFNRDPGAKG